jgi:hypothetical protein
MRLFVLIAAVLIAADPSDDATKKFLAKVKAIGRWNEMGRTHAQWLKEIKVAMLLIERAKEWLLGDDAAPQGSGGQG